MREETFLNQGAVTVEVYTQLINALINRKIKKYISNHPLIHATLMVSVTNLTIGNKIRASYVYRRIISLKSFQKRTLWIRRLTGTQKGLKFMHTGRKK